MPSADPSGDPRSGRDRRVVTKARTFKHGTVDPVIEHRRPLLTWGNAILLAIMVGFGMYATGNLPQLDAFFDYLNTVGRAHNNVVVSGLITYGPYLFAAVILAVFSFFAFLFINSRRRQLSDPKGWEKIANAPHERRRSSRRLQDLPSMILPVAKGGGYRSSKPHPDPGPTAPAVATQEAAQTDIPKPEPPKTSPITDPAKAAAIAAAAKAEAALDAAPDDLPSFVLPFGKAPKPKAGMEPPAAKATPATPEPPAALPAAAGPAPDPAVAAQLEATIAAAKASAAKAEAAMAAAKLEAAIAAAKSETAAAEAAMAAAKAAAIPPTS